MQNASVWQGMSWAYIRCMAATYMHVPVNIDMYIKYLLNYVFICIPGVPSVPILASECLVRQSAAQKIRNPTP